MAQQKTIAAGLEGISDLQKLVADADKKIGEIEAAVDKVKGSNAYKTLVDGNSATFPFGILPDKQDRDYALIINKVNLDPALGMTAEIFMKIPFRNNENLYFIADRVPLSKKGKLTGDFKLILLKSVSFKVGDGYNLKINGLGQGGKGYDSTYVTFNCKGFKDITLNGSLDFDPNTVVEHTDNNNGKPLSLKFYLTADKLTNLIVKFRNVPTLQFKKLPGFKCTVPEITFDRSDLKNAPEFKIPGWYTDSLKVLQPSLDIARYSSVIWEGVYIPGITIEIPNSFTEGSATKTAVITSQDLIVDQYGISALSRAAHVLDGNLKGFKYSIDSLRINVITNRLSKAGIYGKMVFPICKEESTVDYGITITKGLTDTELAYQGYADLKTKLYAEAFGLAQMELQGCRLDFQYKSKQFFPQVDLDGSLMVSASKKNDSKPVGSMGLEFLNLQVLSVSPYVRLGKDGYVRLKADGGTSKLANLPISIDSVRMVSSEGGQRVGLGMALIVHLQNSKGNSNSSGNGFDGKADFTIWAKRNTGSKKWKYDDFDINEISLKIENGSFNLDGSLKMFNGDVVYGKGFCGNLNLELIGKIKVKAAAIFGKKTTGIEKDTVQIKEAYLAGTSVAFETNEEPVNVSVGATVYRYWFADAMVAFTPGIPIATGVEINSFTGGMYYNMKMLKPGEKTGSTLDCKTASGRYFVPNDSLFGVLAGIGLQSMGGGNVFNGEINFGIEFNKVAGGINKIATWGGVGFLTLNFSAPGLENLASKMSSKPVSEDTKSEGESAPPPNESSVKASWYVEYDFPNKTLVGDFNIYVDLAGIVKGQDNGKAGRISIYSSPATWYVYVGRPVDKEMMGLNVLNLATIGGYMCFGSELPKPPIAAMPPEIHPNINIDYNLLSMGGGLSFGARFSINGNPGVDLGLCDARVELRFIVKTGFDILLSKSSKPIYCGTGNVRGFDNWYATGQAFLYGEAGLHASYDCVWPIGSGDIDLFSMYLSAYVFAQLPKPTYLNGGVEVGFTVIGKTFRKSFHIEKGDQCNPVTDLDKDVNFIEAITPADGQQGVANGESIHVWFSNRVNNFEYRIQGSSATDIFRAYMAESGVSVKAGTETIKCFYEINDGNDHVVLTPEKAFPGNTEITVTITVVTQKKNGSGGWDNSGKTEVKTIKFKTVADPGYIAVPDIYYAYPLPGMDNFYKNETTKGYIRLAVLPRKAVQLATDYEFSVGIYESANEIDRTRNVQYRDVYGENNFNFDLPTFRMEPDKEYTIKIMKSPKVTNTSQGSTSSGAVSQGQVDPGRKDSVILEYKFKTSHYSSYREKMAMFGPAYSEIFSGVMAADLTVLNSKGSGVTSEGLSEYEMSGYITEGTKKADPLIKFGKIKYDNNSLDQLNSMIKDISSINLKSVAAGKYSSVTNLINDLNTFLSDINMKCLLSGSCSSEELKAVKIPKGKFTMEIGYYPPGMTTPTSVYNLIVDLDKDLILPQ
jgi:hypothetical protein